jgi:hypothetical protein
MMRNIYHLQLNSRSSHTDRSTCKSFPVGVNSALGYWNYVEVDYVVDVSEEHNSSIFKVKVRVTSIRNMRAACSSETSATQLTSTPCKYPRRRWTSALNHRKSLNLCFVSDNYMLLSLATYIFYLGVFLSVVIHKTSS